MLYEVKLLRPPPYEKYIEYLCLVYGVLYYTHNLVNLAENYWKIKDLENGNGSTKVLFPFGTRSRIIDRRNWIRMNFG